MSLNRQAGWRRWAGEPFVHFALLGVLLFLGHALWQGWTDQDARTILVDPQEMERRAVLFAGENQRNPTEQELQAILYDFVEEEALVREAKALGLDEGDTIVRRRLAQKARFMLEDTADLEMPDQAALCTLLDKQPERFRDPPRRSFAHIFIAPGELSDDALRSKADAVLTRANRTNSNRTNSNRPNWRDLGDPFLLNRAYERASYGDVAKSFGPAFARGLFGAQTSSASFQGPIPSSFGLHLVRIDAAEEGSTPQCAAVLDELEAAWRSDQREAANARSVRAIIDQYEVVVDQ
jgi:hypothetical protein